jgi:hypothetical protein
LRWRLTSLSIIAMLLVACASPSSNGVAQPVSDCCANFGIDVNPLLGPKAVNCGTINTKADSASSRSRNESATACVQRARLRGRAFVVNQGFSIPPDYYLRNVVVFGARGEKVLVQIEHQHDGPTLFVGRCAALELDSSGKLTSSNCEPDDALLEQLK